MGEDAPAEDDDDTPRDNTDAGTVWRPSVGVAPLWAGMVTERGSPLWGGMVTERGAPLWGGMMTERGAPLWGGMAKKRGVPLWGGKHLEYTRARVLFVNMEGDTVHLGDRSLQVPSWR